MLVAVRRLNLLSTHLQQKVPESVPSFLLLSSYRGSVVFQDTPTFCAACDVRQHSKQLCQLPVAEAVQVVQAVGQRAAVRRQVRGARGAAGGGRGGAGGRRVARQRACGGVRPTSMSLPAVSCRRATARGDDKMRFTEAQRGRSARAVVQYDVAQKCVSIRVHAAHTEAMSWYPIYDFHVANHTGENCTGPARISWNGTRQLLPWPPLQCHAPHLPLAVAGPPARCPPPPPRRSPGACAARAAPPAVKVEGGAETV